VRISAKRSGMATASRASASCSARDAGVLASSAVKRPAHSLDGDLQRGKRVL
jgi:hypothetical protein